MSMSFDWNDIPLILALARGGSINAAALELHLDATTVSRRAQAAEQRMNVRLFVRGRTGMVLTEAGRAFVARAADLAGQVNAVVLATASAADTVAGAVRISAIDFLFDHWLLEHAGALAARHPGLRLDLLGGNANVSFTRQEADLALRLSRPAQDAALAMRKLGQLGWAVFGQADGPAPARQDWAGQPWIVYQDGLGHLPEMRWIAREIGAAQSVLRVDSLSTMVRACQAGLGLALLPCMLDADPRLRRLGEQVEVRREVWLLSHRDTVASARIRAVADWLAEVFPSAGAAPLP
jgi:DNA-binding transcriptional LysR family regulator